MHATTITKRTDALGAFQQGALIDGPNDDIIWTCGHVHVPTIYSHISQVAQDCAEYEKQRRMRQEVIR